MNNLAMRPWHLYLIRTNGGSLYTGITTDVSRRFQEHTQQTKQSAKYLRGKGPLTLAYHIKLEGKGEALKIEHRVKQLAKAKKEAIVCANPTRTTLLESLGILSPTPKC